LSRRTSLKQSRLGGCSLPYKPKRTAAIQLDRGELFDFPTVRLDFHRLRALQQPPLPWTPGEPAFWTDPYIAQQMLATHLDPNTDLASRRPEIIDRSVVWIARELALEPGDAVLDLGCGPGLYAARLAAMGLRVTGVDFSQSSLDYASQFARDHNLQISYRCQDYLTLDDRSTHAVALLIYGDFCPLAPDQRRRLLANVHRTLQPGGLFVLDVSRRKPSPAYRSQASWVASTGGFWRSGPHLVLEQAFNYPEQALHLDQFGVIEPSGGLTVYRIWRQEYTPDSIAAELKLGGFEILSLWGDLTGMADSEDSDWIGVVARKMGNR
jgi:SAM-dependent methyltransferase